MRPPVPSRASPPWHVQSSQEVAEKLGVRPEQGLTTAEALRRQQQWGLNDLQRQRRTGLLRLLARQFSDLMILLLAAAAVLSGILGDVKDTFVILVILLLNAAIGFSQDYRAERAMQALRRLAQPAIRVRRDGAFATIPSTALTPGDVVFLEAGNLVPADLRILEAVQLQMEESALTGESEAVHKSTATLPDPDLPLGDRVNMAYRGTVVAKGRGAGLVVATGMRTELGRIATLLQEQPESKTPLQQRLTQFSGRLAAAFLVICGVVLAAGLLRGESVSLMVLTALSLAVAAIPEALPAVVTIALALGARRMAQRQALVRSLPAVETLGSVTWIGSDKTGTLTQNRMRLEQTALADAVAAPDSFLSRRFYEALLLNNDTRPGNHGQWLGDPTETALYAAASAMGMVPEEVQQAHPRIAEIPFETSRRRMTTLHAGGDELLLLVKGSPESVLPLCRTQMDAAGGLLPLASGFWAERANAMAREGLRVLAVASRSLAGLPADPMKLDAVEREMTLLGLAGLIDPPRPEAAAAVVTCRRAGITPVMITGDHPQTARAIARDLGILPDDETSETLLTGADLVRLSDDELDRAAARARVYARVAPEQKIRIIAALQRRGEFVAMTGDGVNDAPALRRADIGVAMGRSGADVAREAADIVLLDDNFATIVTAVAEGRRIFDNIRRFVRYVLTCNSAEIWTLLLAPFLALPIPLQPLQILWINLITDGMPGLALTVEPPEDDVMDRPPRPPRESLFAGGLGAHVLLMGALMAALTLGTQSWAIHTGDAHWQTMTFTTLTLVQIGHVLAVRSERRSLFQLGLGSNLPLAGAVVLTLLLQLGVVYLPAARQIFHTAPLTSLELLLCAACALILFAAVETEKCLRRRRGQNRTRHE